MTPELTALALAGLLQAVQFVVFAVPANLELTPAWTASPRDTPPPRPLSKTTARMQRALSNHFEGLILFTLAVVVVTLGQQASGFTAACAYTYLAARLAYVLGLSPWRSAIWFIGFCATVAMILSALV